MIHEAIATGATIDEAIAGAKKELAAPADADVRTEVIAMPQKKILGLFGGSPAKARAWYETPDAPAKKEVPEKKAAPKAAKPPKAEKPQPPVKAEEKAPEVKAAADEITPVDIKSSASLTSAANYLTAVLKGMGVASLTVDAFRTAEGEIIFELDCGEDYGVVIGRRGDTLDSIQYLTRLVANKQKKENEYLRISINVGNYREKRKNTLRELAKKNSEKVLKYGRNVTFEPMNPYERRIIHTAVQEIEGVTSYSVGADAGRRVVISLAEGVKPTHPSKGGYNRGRGGKGGYNRGGKGRGGNRSSNTVNVTPTRAPRTDAGAEKVSLYGKIN
ncbi:MAG: Jag N-terminal domain-containing protein [Clostridia bacterium]|nr:Jag N-terminal domain-containing protein [Clostridia bacterium]